MLPKDFPPVVYVPCSTDADTGAMSVTLRVTTDGRTALLAYSALDRLRKGAGEDVAWALLTIEDLQRVYEETPYEVLYMDMRIPESARAGAAS